MTPEPLADWERALLGYPPPPALPCKVGDVVTIARGDHTVTGPVEATTNGGRLVVRFNNSIALGITELTTRDGWTLTVHPTPNTPAPAAKEAAPVTETETFTPVTRYDIRTGDTIVATHADGTTLRAVVSHDSIGRRHFVSFGIGAAKRAYLAELSIAGYTFQRVETPLPSKPGAYTDRGGKLWLLHGPNHVAKPWTAWDGRQHTNEYVREVYAPLTPYKG